MTRESTGSEHIFYRSDGETRIWDECVFELIASAAATSGSPLDELRVLDVGCGNGNFLRLAAERGVRAVGVDFDERCVENARQHGEAHRVSGEDLEEVFEPGSFDLVLFSHSLEHFLRPRDVMLSAAIVSAKWIVVAVPNPARLDLLVSNIVRRQSANLGHCYAWDRSHLTVFLERRCGLRIERWHTNHLTLARLPLTMGTGLLARARQARAGRAPETSVEVAPNPAPRGRVREAIERGLRLAEPIERRAARALPFFANDLIVLARVD